MTESTGTCLRCGICCRRQPVPPFMWTDAEYTSLPAELRAEMAGYVDSPAFDDEAPCLWLTPEGCKHYELRPEICREFSPRGESCTYPAIRPVERRLRQGVMTTAADLGAYFPTLQIPPGHRVVAADGMMVIEPYLGEWKPTAAKRTWMEALGWLATVIAVTGVILNNNLSPWCFPVWLASNSLTAYIHLRSKLWALASRDFLFLALCVYGWYHWTH